MGLISGDKPIQEHDFLMELGFHSIAYNHLELVEWSNCKNKETGKIVKEGYRAQYKIGAEWIDENDYIVVTPKVSMEHLDFMGMFMTCFSSDLEVDRFSEIYTIDWDEKPINAPSLQAVVSPLIVLHFLGVVSRIKTLKKGYVHHNENLKKVKGHIDILRNERKNIMMKRYDRIYCKYDEYSEDIPENRLLKKALLFSQRLLQSMGSKHQSYGKMRLMMAKSLSMFERVSDEVQLSEVRQIKTHKLFKEYAEAIRLAKLILRYFDYSISNIANKNGEVVPFTLDMALLYELYVYGLLKEAYGNRIIYQFSGVTGKPDFLYKDRSVDRSAILDTKYKPKYDTTDGIDWKDAQQMSGYGRDMKIIGKLGYDVNEAKEKVPNIPCIIISPEKVTQEDENRNKSLIKSNAIRDYINPFIGNELADFCNEKNAIGTYSRFYKIKIPLPTLCN